MQKPKITVNLFERDLGLSKIRREALAIKKKPYVKAGVTQTRGSKVREDGKLTTAEIARVHEYGAPKRSIPERSFMRSTLARNQGKYDRQILQLRDQIFDANSDMTVSRALALIGESFAKDVKAAIRAGISPPLKLKTIQQKNLRDKASAEKRVKRATETVDRLTAKATGGLKAAQRLAGVHGPGYPPKRLSEKEKHALNRAAEVIITGGGASTALIDTGQMINALSYEVVLDGTVVKGGEI